jgi:hypothetical protein
MNSLTKIQHENARLVDEKFHQQQMKGLLLIGITASGKSGALKRAFGNTPFAFCEDNKANNKAHCLQQDISPLIIDGIHYFNENELEQLRQLTSTVTGKKKTILTAQCLRQFMTTISTTEQCLFDDYCVLFFSRNNMCVEVESFTHYEQLVVSQ